MLFGIDAVHGAAYVSGATIFPHQINMGASFNLALVGPAAAITAKDCRAASLPWVYAPMLDIAVQPAWARVYETFGECPYLTSEMGVTMIRNLQGWNEEKQEPTLGAGDKVAATFKHFLGYSNPRDGHDRTENWIPDRALLEYFLPPFEAAIHKGKIASGMLAYADLNGIPMTTSSQLTVTLLRDLLTFNGTLITDWNEIMHLHSWHRVAPSMKEAISLALRTSSLDIALLPDQLDVFFESMQLLVAAEVIPHPRLNMAVARVLQLKKNLGLVTAYPMNEAVQEESGVSKQQEKLIETVGSQEDRDVALQLAHESIILLQNDGTLPLHLGGGSSTSSRPIRRILVVGPTGNSIRHQTGGWTFHWQGAASEEEFKFGSSVFQAIQTYVSNLPAAAAGGGDDAQDIIVTYRRGVEMDGSYTDEALKQALDAAKQSDVIFVCLGESSYAEKVGDIPSLPYPGVNRI